MIFVFNRCSNSPCGFLCVNLLAILSLQGITVAREDWYWPKIETNDEEEDDVEEKEEEEKEEEEDEEEIVELSVSIEFTLLTVLQCVIVIH